LANFPYYLDIKLILLIYIRVAIFLRTLCVRKCKIVGHAVLRISDGEWNMGRKRLCVLFAQAA